MIDYSEEREDIGEPMIRPRGSTSASGASKINKVHPLDLSDNINEELSPERDYPPRSASPADVHVQQKSVAATALVEKLKELEGGRSESEDDKRFTIN